MARNGNPASITDAGVGALCLDTCIQGAGLNVRINLAGIKDQALKASLAAEVQELVRRSGEQLKNAMAMVESKM
jgi:glutamate formiminotransferase/formiminotetrahydrofolate cyclodeaminase